MQLTVSQENNFQYTISNGDFSVQTDASSTIGGGEKGFRPTELLLGALATCFGIDLVLVLKKQRFVTENLVINVQAERNDKSLSTFEVITLEITHDAEIPSDKVEKAAKMSIERLCSVKAMLHPDIQVVYSAKSR